MHSVVLSRRLPSIESTQHVLCSLAISECVIDAMFLFPFSKCCFLPEALEVVGVMRVLSMLRAGRRERGNVGRV